VTSTEHCDLLIQALARAVYSKLPTLILDDVFSAVDQDTAHLMLTRLLGPEGLLRKSKSTVIIATHSRTYRSNI